MNNDIPHYFKPLLEIEGVEFLHVTGNYSINADIKTGLPGFSYKIYIKGAKKKEIANCLFMHKPLGVRLVGNTRVKVKDTAGFKHWIYFERLL